MKNRLAERGVSVLLLDVEGTTTPISFVSDVLFPYAREHLREYLHDHADEDGAAGAIGALRNERARQPPEVIGRLNDADSAGGPAAIASYAEWLMDRDVKSPGLKALQGLIWKIGYDSGELHGEVFDDVPDAFRAAKAAGVRVAIYSSGSVLAQRLLFESTRFGDLTLEISAFFDTEVGAKGDVASYAEIARRLARRPDEILFVSDIVAELEAARSAGCQVALAVRPGNVPASGADGVWTVERLSEIVG